MQAAANSKRMKKLNAINPEEQERIIRNYCDRHPLGNYLDAVIVLYRSLPDY